MSALVAEGELESMGGEEEKESKSEEAKEKMKPWEQHAGVINMPRFDYNAPSALLHHSHSGFLITCSITVSTATKPEAKKEEHAVRKVPVYLASDNSGSSESLQSSNGNERSESLQSSNGDERSEILESSNGNDGTKRRKICTDETKGKCAEDVKSKTIIVEIGVTGGPAKDDRISLEKVGKTIERGCDLSLVKLTRSGLVLLTFPRENSPDATDIVSNIFQCLESGKIKSPLWCHRIFPIQATCLLIEKELRAVVSKLVLQFFNDKQNKLARPIKFAVGYNRRGLEETCTKNLKDSSKDSDLVSMLDRSKCFGVVASVIKEIVPESFVDLKSPELSILVELLPLSGVPSGQLVAAVSILPLNLVSVKPRLCIKALLSDTNTRNKS